MPLQCQSPTAHPPPPHPTIMARRLPCPQLNWPAPLKVSPGPWTNQVTSPGWSLVDLIKPWRTTLILIPSRKDPPGRTAQDIGLFTARRCPGKPLAGPGRFWSRLLCPLARPSEGWGRRRRKPGVRGSGVPGVRGSGGLGVQRAGGEGPKPGLPFPPAEGTNRGGEGPNLPGGDGGGRERPRGGERGQSPPQGLTTRERRANDRTLTRAGGGRPRGPHAPRSGGAASFTETLRPAPLTHPRPRGWGSFGPGRGDRAGSLDARVSQKGLFSSGCLCSLDGAREDAPPQPQELPGRSPSPVLGLGRRGEPQGRPRIVHVAVSRAAYLRLHFTDERFCCFFFSKIWVVQD